MLPLKTTVIWFLIYAKGLLDTVLFSVLYFWLGLLVVGCKQGLANSLLDGANFARWSAHERDDSHYLISSLLHNLLFSHSKVFFHILFSDFFFFLSVKASAFIMISPWNKQGNSVMQPGRVSKVHFSQEEQEKGNNGLRNWKKIHSM